MYDDEYFGNSFDNSSLSADDVRQIAAEQAIRTLQALQQGVAVVEQLKAEALRKAEENHPGFLRRYYDTDVCRKFMEEKPAMARAIANAETGQGTESLSELYQIFDTATRNYEVSSQSSNRAGTPSATGPSVLTLNQINALPPEQRRAHIAALGERVADLPLDEADPENSIFKRERGE